MGDECLSASLPNSLSIGYVWKIDDFTIKPIEQQSFLLTGFSRHISPGPSFRKVALSTTAIGGRIGIDATCNRAQEVRAVSARALALRWRKPLSSEDDACSSEDGQGRSSSC
jgi:hypothetical protein